MENPRGEIVSFFKNRLLPDGVTADDAASLVPSWATEDLLEAAEKVFIDLEFEEKLPVDAVITLFSSFREAEAKRHELEMESRPSL